MAKKKSARKAPSTPPRAAARTNAPSRTPIVSGLVAIVVLALAAWWSLRDSSFTVSQTSDRNVLLVSIDTLRADVLGTYGGRATTPNLDRLAAHGARFDFAHAHSVVTLVSHTTMLTGHYPYEHGVRDNTGYRLAPTQATAATRLKMLGFTTGAFVGGFPLDHRFGLGVGFDVYDDHLTQVMPNGESNDRERRADAVVSAALEWIGKQSGKWFSLVHVYDPHAPYAPPAEWGARFPSDPYLGEVSWTDSALGVLFDRLATQSRPTLVIVTGDHGESLGEHGELTHSIFAYEPTLHIPLIVSEIPAGRPSTARGVAIETPVRHVDLLPTMLDAVGAPADSTLPGASLRPVIAAGRGPDRPSYFEAMTATIVRGWAPLRGVLVGREKYIDLPITELYDLAADPHEANNLFASKPDRAAFLYNTLKGFNIAPPGHAQVETTETVERLRSLGYIGGGTTVREKFTDADDPKRLIELEQMLTKATDAFRAAHFDEAAEMFKIVIAKRPDTEDAYRKLALVYWRTQRPVLAISTLEAALKAGVTQSEVKIKLGQYLVETGKVDQAIALLESFAGDDPDALVGLGNAYGRAGRRADAIRTYRHLLMVDPNNALAHQNLGIAALEANDVAVAETELRHALALDPSLPEANNGLGVIFSRLGRNSEAIDAWKRAVELDAAELNALFNLTKTLVEAGRLDEARVYGERFIARAPQNPEAQQDVATIRKLLGK
jgi:arylsulfatase A-like enzyme/Tfp pilus assembly protein PilF